MADKLTAATLGDPLVHSSLLADFASGLAEGAIYLAVFSAGAAMAASGVGVALGAALVVGAMVNGFPERIGSLVSDTVDGLLDSLGMRGPPDATITSGSPNVRIRGKAAARAAGIVDMITDLPAEGPAVDALTVAMAMAAGVADTVRHPGAFLSALGDSISQTSAQDVGDLFKHTWHDTVRPVVESASPFASPAARDSILCSKHASDADNVLAEGCEKVLINGQPAVRNGHRSSCEAKVEVSDDTRVRIGGNTMVVREIRSGKSAIACFIGNLLGGGLGKELGAMAIQLLDRSVARLMVRRALRQTVCALGGEAAGTAISASAAAGGGAVARAASHTPHPVNIALGSKILAGEEDLDFVLQDRIPLYWQRVWHSRNAACGMLGSGWMLPFETRLLQVRAPDGSLHFTWRDISGRELGLGEVRPGDVIQFHEDGFTLYCTLQGVLVMQTAQGEFFLYEPDSTRTGEWRIARQYDRHDNCQHFSWNDAGQLVAITGDNEALDVRLSYEPQHGRLAAVHQQVDGAPRLLVRYDYNAGGQLLAVRDADGVVTRRFSWDRASDLLASHGYASGMNITYRWQPAAGAANWRVAEYQVCDGTECLEHWLIDCDEQARRATVTCLSGSSSEHCWDEQGRITAWTDGYGAQWRYRWAEEGELLLSSEGPEGRRWEYGYDDRANLTRVTDPLGRATLTRWHPVWALPEQEVTADGAAWRYQYNAAGDLVTVTDPEGGVTRFDWNTQGDLISRTDALDNTQHFWWDARGQLLRDEDCSGQKSHRCYDAAGMLVSHTDAAGNGTRWQWSPAGRLRMLLRADGRETRYEYDEAGQPCAEIVDGHSERRVKRNVRGQVIGEIDPAGHATRYRYDRFGRMTGLINANGERWQFEYDNGVRLLAQTDYAGRRSRYRYDVLGQLTAVTRQPLANDTPPLPEQTTLMEYDALGRISAKQTAEQRTAYAYQPHGITLHRVALARWRQAQSAGRAAEWDETLTFSHDALGNLLSEENHGGRWQHQYDALGNLQQSTTPDGAALRFMRYGSGHLLQVDLQQAGRRVELAGYRRDALHREVTRSQGPLSLETRYDRAGRIVMRRSALLERRYQWDGLDRVTQQMLIQGGGAKADEAEFAQQRFGYDALGQVISRLRPQHAERFHYDAAGNRTAHPGQTVWHNLLLRLQGARWEYDGFGRLAWRRAGRDGTEQRFAYDDEHRVSEVTLTGHREYSRAVYRYDLLGRRTQKILYRHGEAEENAEVIHFDWSGLRMVGERSSRTPQRRTRYIYGEGGWEPLARVDSVGEDDPGEVFWYHTELNGLPERMTDEYGERVWQGRFSAWGEAEHESSPRGLRQNLRFQGQYFDAETGLHYNLFRYYDPAGGRFTQTDPIGLAGGLNLYAYAPNPLSWIDPLGLAKCHFSGDRGRNKAAHDLQQNGYTVIAEELTMRVNGSRVRADFVAVDGRGSIHVFEAKHGAGGLTPNQKASGVFDMNSPSNTAGGIGGGTITSSSGTKGTFSVATSNTQKSGALGPKGTSHDATFHVLHY
ncbi:RHS repeat-associated core domain-containing protein [Erwinia amylovora]|uniref:RHS repeat-associated core domain-containing protein n=1 Tax=Erwinia amylovora TaxID=552 RepID=UPI0035C71FF6